MEKIFALACCGRIKEIQSIMSLIIEHVLEVILRNILGKGLFNRSNDPYEMSIKSWKKGDLHTGPIRPARRRVPRHQCHDILLDGACLCS
jgi:hypothetical protein